MSAERYSPDKSKSLLHEVVKVTALGVGAGMTGVSGITAKHHREETHRSLELSVRLQNAIDWEQASLGIKKNKAWPAVHRLHHRETDASRDPFYRAYHAIRIAEKRNISYPDDFPYLDPFVIKFPRSTVMEIGEGADHDLQKQMGPLYVPPEFRTDEDIYRTLHPTEPQYYYPKYVKKRSAGEYHPDEMARNLLTDPHSPALMRSKNGVQGVAVGDIYLYKTPADMFGFLPQLKDEDLQRPEDFLPDDGSTKREIRRAVAAGFAVPMGVLFVANRDYSLRGLSRAIVEGAAVNGIRAGVEVLAGGFTNGPGHMGDPVQIEIGGALLNRSYTIKLRAEDGTLATNTVGKGVIGRLSSWATLDEVGGQQIHHEKPWKIAYTDATGVRAVIEAPWGSLLEYLAYNEHMSSIQPGKGFGDQPRRDMPNDGLLLIQRERIRPDNLRILREQGRVAA